MGDTILQVKNLKKYFHTKRGVLYAVDGVSFSIERGKTLGIVGESGCGKSTVGKSMLRLVEPTSGEILFEGKDITKFDKKQIRNVRKEMQIIFQDPFASLNPRKTVSQLIQEPLLLNHLTKGRKETETRVLELMRMVGLDERLYNSYPHELDGGRCQRIGIARALAMNPKFILCDEPVSALDVSIQAQVLNLLKDLQDQLGLTYIFITHDLSVVHFFADDILVMYLGQVVEKASAEELFDNPLHPYTKALLSAIPVPELGERKERILLKGEIASPIDPPKECRFAKRCNCVCDECRKGIPQLREVSPGHFLACCIAESV